MHSRHEPQGQRAWAARWHAVGCLPLVHITHTTITRARASARAHTHTHTHYARAVPGSKRRHVGRATTEYSDVSITFDDLRPLTDPSCFAHSRHAQPVTKDINVAIRAAS